MQKKIVIASVLKPIDDVRSFWKLSQSMAKTNKYEVNIIGNDSKNAIEFPNVKFHKHTISRNNWLKRYYIRFKILFIIINLKPSLLIISDHELIGIASWYGLINRCKIIYDVQENYYLNLKRIDPSLLKSIYANVVRLKEVLSRRFTDEYWLAEKCYEHKLPFAKDKSLIIENKAYALDINRKETITNRLVFTGTISNYSRIDLAIEIFKKLLDSDPSFTLNIVGQVHDEKVKRYLLNEAKKLPGLILNISRNPIPHQQIISAIISASLGIIAYQPTEVNQNKIPTKLYEYSRYQLPYLVQQDTYWNEVGEELGGAIPVDFGSPNAARIAEILKDPSNLFSNPYPVVATWEYESEKLLKSINRLIS